MAIGRLHRSMHSRRLVLCPYGLPTSVDGRSACLNVMLRAGGDPNRVVDGPTVGIEVFGRHVIRLAAVRHARLPPLVLLTRTSPVALAVVTARRKLETLIPKLERSPWLLFHDRHEEPFSIATAAELGKFDIEDPALLPVWTGPDARRYLFIDSDAANLDLLPHRLIELAEGDAPASHERRKSTGSIRAVNVVDLRIAEPFEGEAEPHSQVRSATNDLTVGELALGGRNRGS